MNATHSPSDHWRRPKVPIIIPAGRDWPLGQCCQGNSNDHLRLIAGKWACEICHREWTGRGNRKAREKRRAA